MLSTYHSIVQQYHNRVPTHEHQSLQIFFYFLQIVAVQDPVMELQTPASLFYKLQLLHQYSAHLSLMPLHKLCQE